jgi:hypothetical protein
MSDFTLDDDFHNEILRLSRTYYQQAEKCHDNGAFLAGCVMIGAALEATLLAFANCFPEDVLVSSLELLAVAKDRNWLPSGLSLDDEWDAAKAKIGDYAEVVRRVRNLVHPARYAKEMPRKRITKQYLESSFNIMHIATQHLENKILKSLHSLAESDAENDSA